jgi:hypothetical protein
MLAGSLSKNMSVGPKRKSQQHWRVGLGKLVKALDAARSRGSGCEVEDLL